MMNTPVSPGEIRDLNISRNQPLPTPAALMQEIARSDEQASFVVSARQQIHDVLFGDDDRFLLVVGPCSIHDVDAGKAYAKKLADAAEALNDRLLVVMRVYFEKPRTNVGWKGLIMDPRLDETNDIETGLKMARRFLLEVLEAGLPTATELLDPITPQYLADLICWSAIGARTTESQTHRQMASGLSMPLGFKNGTSGDLVAAVNAILAATQPQTFLGVSEQGTASAVTTRGNPACHVILRGGASGPNYSAADVDATSEKLAVAGLPQAIMIDCSHGNSNKQPARQPEVLDEVIALRTGGRKSVIGAMVESNLVAGAQKFPQPLDQLVYGQSITDGCIGWDETEAMLQRAYDALG